MEKQQGKGIVLKHQIKKERVANYPFYLISAIYSHEPDYHFLVVVDYSLENTILSIHPFTQDMSRLPACSITIADILPHKIVSSLHINLLRYKAHPQSITILEAQFILGHRSGQLVVIHYQDKQCKVIQRLNKALKGQGFGFLNKTSSFFFGNQQSYTPFFKEPIKAFQAYPTHPNLRYSYQVGNTIIFMRDLNESQQFAFFSIYETNNAEHYAFRYDLGTPAEKSPLIMYGTEDYYAIKDSSRKIALLNFQHQVSSYACLSLARKQIAVARSTKEDILLIQTNKFTIKTKIQTSMSIRRLSCFTYNQDQYIAIMVYDNYVLLYNVEVNKFCKLTGHRSFVATVAFDQQEQMLVSAGMDHRISLVQIGKIKQNNWAFVDKSDKTKILDDQECQALRFPEIFSLGQYNNVRTNLHSYGYGDFLMLNNHYCLMTYDAKAVIYKYA